MLSDERKVLAAVIASTFFVGFGGGVVFPILPNLGAVLGISSFMVGIILSANRWVRLVANAPAGALVDRIGTRKPFVVGLAIEAVGTLGYVVALRLHELTTIVIFGVDLTAPAGWFVAARVLWGLGSAMVFATAYTIAADVSDSSSMGTDMGVVRGGILLGFPAGLVLGGIVSDLAGNEAAFWVAGAFAMLASVIAYVTVPETHVEESRDDIKPWEIDTNIPAITVGLVNFSLLFAYIGALFSTLVLFLGEHDIRMLGLDAQGTSGLLMAVTVLSAAVLMLAGGKASDLMESRVPVLITFLSVFLVGFVIFTFTTSLPLLLLACILIGAGQGGTSGPMMALLADLTPDDRMGRAMGTNNVFGDIGGGLGPLVSLPLIDVIGFRLVYALCAMMPLLAGTFLLLGIYRETGELRPGTAGTTDRSSPVDPAEQD